MGESDLEFIVEHSCLKYDIKLIHDDKKEQEPDVFYLYSESYIPDESITNAGFLQQLMEV